MRVSAILAVTFTIGLSGAQAADLVRFKCEVAAVQVRNLRVPIGYKSSAAIEIDRSSGQWTLAWFDDVGKSIGNEKGTLAAATDNLFTLKDEADKTPTGEGHTLQTVDRLSGAFIRDSRGKNAGVDVVLRQVGTCKPSP